MYARRPQIDSIGYEGASIEQVVAALEDAGVEVVADIRIRPQSRKPGFSKSTLAASLAAAGIGYVHHRALGTPLPIREHFRSGDIERGRAEYLHHLETDVDAGHALAELAELATEKRVAVLCFERDERECHRLTTLAELERRDLASVGRHLRP